MVDRDMQAQLKGWSLTTADHVSHAGVSRPAANLHLAELRRAPQFPRLIGFLNFWARNLTGRCTRYG